MQVNWLLSNIQKDKEEQFELIESVVDTLKFYINPEMYKKEQELKKQNHKTTFDNELIAKLKDKGLSDDQLKMLDDTFK